MNVTDKTYFDWSSYFLFGMDGVSCYDWILRIYYAITRDEKGKAYDENFMKV